MAPLMSRLGTINASTMKRVMNFYPPWLGAGIRITELDANFTHAKVSMPLTWYNRNIAGVHFGGSLYAMCDPLYMLLLLRSLGPSYIVWDKAASIDFVKPGQGTVTAEFRIKDELLDKLHLLEPNEKKIIELPFTVLDDKEETVARGNKVIYIRRKGVESKL